MNAQAKITPLNSNQVLSIINEIASASGKAKDQLLSSYLAIDNGLLMTALKAALDPFVTYGVKKLPTKKVTDGNGAVFGPSTFELLDDLSSRALTGNAAQSAIESELNRLTEDSADLLGRIITKDLRAGFSAKSVNRIAPGSIFVFECMLSHKFEPKRVKTWPIAGEIKLDGVRAIAIYKKGEVKLYSRTGKEFTNFNEVAKQLKTFVEMHSPFPVSPGKTYKVDTVMDGELMTGAFNDTAGDIHRKDTQADNAWFTMFELMTDVEFNVGSSRPYKHRRATLEAAFKDVDLSAVKMTDCWSFNSVDEILEKQNEILAAGGEGLIIKPLLGTYENKRSHNWLKIKACDSVDVMVTDVEEGTGKFEGRLGALVVDFNGVLVNVGSGLTDELRISMEEAKRKYVGRLVEVQYHEVTPDKSLRHPRYVRFRDDKPVEDGVGV